MSPGSFTGRVCPFSIMCKRLWDGLELLWFSSLSAVISYYYYLPLNICSDYWTLTIW